MQELILVRPFPIDCGSLSGQSKSLNKFVADSICHRMLIKSGVTTVAMTLDMASQQTGKLITRRIPQLGKCDLNASEKMFHWSEEMQRTFDQIVLISQACDTMILIVHDHFITIMAGALIRFFSDEAKGKVKPSTVELPLTQYLRRNKPYAEVHGSLMTFKFG